MVQVPSRHPHQGRALAAPEKRGSYYIVRIVSQLMLLLPRPDAKSLAAHVLGSGSRL